MSELTKPTIPISTNLISIGQGIGIGADVIGSFIPLKKEYLSDKGAITAGIDSGWNTLANTAAQFGPAGQAVGGLMKGAGLVGKGLNALGGGTDGMTTTDAILGSDVGTVLTLGLNGFTGKKADTMAKNYEDFAQVGSSYGGTEAQVNNALKYSGKKYGGLSSNARKKANNLMALAGQQQWKIGLIANDARIGHELLSNMADINENAYAFNRMGGYNQGSVIAARLGLKIEKARDILNKDIQFEDEDDNFIIDYSSINKFLKGGEFNLNEKPSFKEWVKDVNPNFNSPNYDLETAYKVLPFEQLQRWKTATNSPKLEYYMNYQDPKTKEFIYHLPSIYKMDNGNYMFLKKGTEQINPEVHFETDTYHDGSNGLINTHDLIFNSKDNRYYYIKKSETPIFKEGGQMNLIPEGALHARKHNMDDPNLDGQITKKGIPVVIDKGLGEIELVAEIEHSEIVFNKDTTTKLEELYSKFKEDISKSEKDALALEAGKLLTDLILNNTDDRVGLIDKV